MFRFDTSHGYTKSSPGLRATRRGEKKESHIEFKQSKKIQKIPPKIRLSFQLKPKGENWGRVKIYMKVYTGIQYLRKDCDAKIYLQ